MSSKEKFKPLSAFSFRPGRGAEEVASRRVVDVLTEDKPIGRVVVDAVGGKRYSLSFYWKDEKGGFKEVLVNRTLTNLQNIVTEVQFKQMRKRLGDFIDDLVNVLLKDPPVFVKEKLGEGEVKATPEAVELAKDPLVLMKLNEVYDMVIVREHKNRMLAYLTAASRLNLSKPKLCLELKGDTATGKSHVLDNSLEAWDNVFFLTAATAKSLRRAGKAPLRLDFSNQVLYIAERGAIDQVIDFRELITRGELKILSTEKAESGALFTEQLCIYGDPPIITSEVKPEMRAEWSSRMLFSSADMSAEQTELIIKKQKHLAENPHMEDEFKAKCGTFRAFSHLLDKYKVSIPEEYNIEKFLTVSTHRLRRDFEKLKALIRTLSLIHQYQRLFYRKDEEMVVISLPADVILAVAVSWDALTLSVMDLSPIEFEIWSCSKEVIESEGYAVPHTVSDKLSMSTGYVAQNMDSLVVKGYLVAGTHPDDKRKKAYYLGKVLPERDKETVSGLINELIRLRIKKVLERYSNKFGGLHQKVLEADGRRSFRQVALDEAVDFCGRSSKPLLDESVLLSKNSPFYLDFVKIKPYGFFKNGSWHCSFSDFSGSRSDLAKHLVLVHNLELEEVALEDE